MYTLCSALRRGPIQIRGPSGKIIPDICHLGHLHVGGEEICHVEKFQISIHGISPHEEEFQFFHTTDVEKCEFLPNLVKFHISPQDRCEEI